MKPHRSIAINDIVVPVRIEVNSKEQLMAVIRAAHNVRDAMEITLKGTNFTYYICAMNDWNPLYRRYVLRRAAGLLRDIPAEKFLDKVLGEPTIPESIFYGRVG